MQLLAKVFFLSALAASTAQAQQPDAVRLATLAPGALLWVHNIADVKGFYEENGLDVQRLQVADSPALVQAVASGSADAGVSLGDLVIKAIDQGAPIEIVGGYLTKTSLRLVGAKDVESIEDLAGSKMTAGAVTGGTTNLMLYQLLQHGVDPNSIQRISIPNSRDRVVALEQGHVRGAVMTPPFDIMAQSQGYPILDTYREPFLQTPLIVNTNWAESKPDIVKRLVRATQQAAEWIYDPTNRDEAIDILAQDTGVSVEIAEASYDFLVADQQAYSRDLSIPEEAFTNIVKIDRAVNAGAQAGDPVELDIAKYYNPGYLSTSE
jgi:ABC-type nitrate/sulfonate/bicarbonate transport system substrate-binding protein